MKNERDAGQIDEYGLMNISRMKEKEYNDPWLE